MKNHLQRILFTLSLFITIPFFLSAQLSLTFNSSLTSSFIAPPDVSAVMADPTDPATNAGVVVDVKEGGVPITSALYTISASSNKTSVISNANILITKADGIATIKIIPTGVGYATVTLTLTKSSSSTTLQIKYAVSASAATPANTRFHTGISNGSAAIALDDNFMVIADDESNKLFVYNRNNSGLPLSSFYFGDGLALTDGSVGNYKELDLEAATRSKIFTNRVYWLGSMSNSSSNNIKPNRNRIFATNITGTGASTSITLGGFYKTLREKLIAWGNTNGYNLTASAADGKDSKAIDGFNIEGMCFGPDNTTLYICFRAPLVPISNRTKALIAPIQNFETWFNNGSPAGDPVIGSPIEISIGGRGIRDMISLSSGGYLILAGGYSGSGTPAVYTWTGLQIDQPILQTGFMVSGLNLESVVEINENGLPSANKFQFISDNGNTEYYSDGTASADLTTTNFEKFRSDIITAGTILPVVLEYFSAQRKNKFVTLSWKAHELAGIDSFFVLKSDNGFSFGKIASLGSKNNGALFSFDDYLTTVSNSSYYQLAMKMSDGSLSYSPVRIISNDENYIVKAYPNPVQNNMLSIATGTSNKMQAILVDANGIAVRTVSFINFVDISTSGLAQGIYRLMLLEGQKIIYTKNIVVAGK